MKPGDIYKHKWATHTVKLIEYIGNDWWSAKTLAQPPDSPSSEAGTEKIAGVWLYESYTKIN